MEDAEIEANMRSRRAEHETQSDLAHPSLDVDLANNGLPDESSDEMVIETEPQQRPDAISLQGVDEMSTEDVEAYVRRFFEARHLTPQGKPAEQDSASRPQGNNASQPEGQEDGELTSDTSKYASKLGEASKFRIEWVNDTSCNIIFENESACKTALRLIRQDPVEAKDSIELPAHVFADMKNTGSLRFRVARTDDRKIRGARECSRWYLMHPDKIELERSEARMRMFQSRERRSTRRNRRRSISPRQRAGDYVGRYDDDDEDNDLLQDTDFQHRNRTFVHVAREQPNYEDEQRTVNLFPEKFEKAVPEFRKVRTARSGRNSRGLSQRFEAAKPTTKSLLARFEPCNDRETTKQSNTLSDRRRKPRAQDLF